MTTIEYNHEAEMAFAREFFNKAIEGLDSSNIMDPDAWLEDDVNGELTQAWQAEKIMLSLRLQDPEVEVIVEEKLEDGGIKEVKTTNKAIITAMLDCAFCKYFDLMANISDKLRQENREDAAEEEAPEEELKEDQVSDL